MHFEFSETLQTANITFYKKPEDGGHYEIHQNGKSITVSRNEIQVEKIMLYREARIFAVNSDDHKIAVVLHKEEASRWHGINGPAEIQQIKQTDYTEETDAMKDEKPKDLFEVLENVYFKGDEETKKAMMKSFRESNGSVLSTNWKHVKDEKYEE